VSTPGKVSLRGLHGCIVDELPLGLQLRSTAGTKTPWGTLRTFTYRLREQQVESVFDVDIDGVNYKKNVWFWRSITALVPRNSEAPATTERKVRNRTATATPC
jgi:hypothetical protein